jgi:NADH-quinone oxidoreductase subunit E
VARLTPDNLMRARSLVALYPHKRSALIPLLHIVQEQEGYLSPEGMGHVAELLDLTTAEVRGTASFYDMFHLEPVGRYLVAVCTNIACVLAGGYEMLEHVGESTGTHPGGTSEDGTFTLEEAECLALCGNAPCVTVNWRFFGDMTPERWDALAEDLRAGRLDDEVPPHGTLCRVQRSVGLLAGAVAGAAATPGGTGTPGAATGTTRAAPGKARAGRGRSQGGADKGPTAPAQAPVPVDSQGRRVELGTVRTTTAVASTVLAGARQADGSEDR